MEGQATPEETTDLLEKDKVQVTKVLQSIKMYTASICYPNRVQYQK